MKKMKIMTNFFVREKKYRCKGCKIKKTKSHMMDAWYCKKCAWGQLRDNNYKHVTSGGEFNRREKRYIRYYGLKKGRFVFFDGGI